VQANHESLFLVNLDFVVELRPDLSVQVLAELVREFALDSDFLVVVHLADVESLEVVSKVLEVHPEGPVIRLGHVFERLLDLRSP